LRTPDECLTREPHQRSLSAILDRAVKDRAGRGRSSALFAARGIAFARFARIRTLARANLRQPRELTQQSPATSLHQFCLYRSRVLRLLKGKRTRASWACPLSLARRDRSPLPLGLRRGAVDALLAAAFNPPYTATPTKRLVLPRIKSAVPACTSTLLAARNPQGGGDKGRAFPDFLAGLRFAAWLAAGNRGGNLTTRCARSSSLTRSDSAGSTLRPRTGSIAHDATIIFGHVDAPRHWRAIACHPRCMRESAASRIRSAAVRADGGRRCRVRGHSRFGRRFARPWLMHAVGNAWRHPLLAPPDLVGAMGPEGAARACSRRE